MKDISISLKGLRPHIIRIYVQTALIIAALVQILPSIAYAGTNSDAFRVHRGGLFVGRNYPHEEWKGTDDHDEFSLELDSGKDSWPVLLATDITYSWDSSVFNIDDQYTADASSFQLYVGARKHFTRGLLVFTMGAGGLYASNDYALYRGTSYEYVDSCDGSGVGYWVGIALGSALRRSESTQKPVVQVSFRYSSVRMSADCDHSPGFSLDGGGHHEGVIVSLFFK